MTLRPAPNFPSPQSPHFLPSITSPCSIATDLGLGIQGSKHDKPLFKAVQVGHLGTLSLALSLHGCILESNPFYSLDSSD